MNSNYTSLEDRGVISLEERGVIFERRSNGAVRAVVTIDGREYCIGACRYNQNTFCDMVLTFLSCCQGEKQISCIDKETGQSYNVTILNTFYERWGDELGYYSRVRESNISFLTPKANSLKIESLSERENMQFKVALIGLISTSAAIRAILRWNPEAFKILESLEFNDNERESFFLASGDQQSIEERLGKKIEELCGEADIEGPT